MRFIFSQGNESLQVVLVKQMQSLEWSSLLKDIVVPPSDMPIQPIRELSLPPSNLRSEMEECDFGDDEMDKEHTFGKAQIAPHDSN